MTAHLRMTDGERLAALAAWLDQAARWFAREVRDSRAHQSIDCDDTDPEQRVETVTFLTAELDAVVGGIRRAADTLVALVVPLPDPIMPVTPPAPAPKRPRTHMRLVE